MILIGCSEGDNFKRFDNSELKEELKVEGINPKLPTKFPVTIVEYERKTPPQQSNIHEIIFKGKDGELFSLIIDSATTEYNDFEKEDVEINGNSGFYVESKLPGPSIHWTDGEFHFIFQYQTTNLEKTETKEVMIGIAESFQ